MHVEILLAILIGVLSGIFTGLIPGIHVNLVTLLAVSYLSFDPLLTACAILSLAITHTFLDAIPSIYLGCPDSDHALSVLPGHRLLIQGYGHKAVSCTVVGSLFSIIIGSFFFSLCVISMKWTYPLIKNHIAYLLCAIIVYLILADKNPIRAVVIFVLAGGLGLLVLNAVLEQPLFHMLSGLFGVSILILSVQSKMPKQEMTSEIVHIKTAVKASSVAAILGYFSAFLPGFGSSQAAVIGTKFTALKDTGFLVLSGGINTAGMFISLATYYALDKARNGAIIGVRSLIGSLTSEYVMMLIGVLMICGGAATILAFIISGVFAKAMSVLNYSFVVRGVILLIFVLSFIFDSFSGITVLITASALGVYVSSINSPKSHLMGCLILPVILMLW